MAVSLFACGRPTGADDSAAEPTNPTTPLETTTVPPVPTLGVTPDEFVAEWNSLLRVHRFLLIDEFDIDDGTSLIRRFTDEWGLELTVDADSGELTVAELEGSLNVHPDQGIMLFLTWLSLVQASNPSLDFDWVDDFWWVPERIGLPSPSDEEPEGLGSGSYSSEGEIEGVIYNFEESGYDTVLTARPATP